MLAACETDVIETARLELRRQRPEDAEALYGLMADWDVIRMTGSWPWPLPPELARQRIVERMAEPGFYGIAWRDGTPVGVASVAGGEIGYLVGKAHWGQGYATELARAVVDHGFGILGEMVLTAKVWADNPASSRVLEKLGFAFAGEGVEPCLARGTDERYLSYALARPLTGP